MRRSAIFIGIFGSVLAVGWTIVALTEVGGNPLYQSRLWAGIAALVFSVLGAACAFLISTRPMLASFLMVVSGLLGFVCVSLFYINTLFILAVPCWLISFVLAVMSARRPSVQR